MQHHIEFDPNEKVLIGTTSGMATAEGLRKFIDDLAEHPRSDECVGVIADHRNVSFSLFTADDARYIAHHVTSYADRSRGRPNPIVVSRAEDYGMARMYELLGDSGLGLQTHVCYNLEDAYAWITSGESCDGTITDEVA
jgi:hypothetical protein